MRFGGVQSLDRYFFLRLTHAFVHGAARTRGLSLSPFFWLRFRRIPKIPSKTHFRRTYTFDRSFRIDC